MTRAVKNKALASPLPIMAFFSCKPPNKRTIGVTATAPIPEPRHAPNDLKALIDFLSSSLSLAKAPRPL